MFKSVKTYNEERYGGKFILRDDKDFADVIFLYRSLDDVLIADTHYIKSDKYSGYVHCCGRGCPACAKGIRVQSKLFIPLYNVTDKEIQFWDRSTRFEMQLNSDIFSKFPNPSEYVFRITRNGAAGDINTTYSITPVMKSSQGSYDEILNQFNVKMPDHYETICRDISASELSSMLTNSSGTSDYSDLPSYQVTPRGSSSNNSSGPVPTVHDAPPDYEPIDIPTDDDNSPIDGDDDIGDVVF